MSVEMIHYIIRIILWKIIQQKGSITLSHVNMNTDEGHDVGKQFHTG